MISPKEIQEKASRKFKDFLLHEINVMFNKPVDSFFPLIIRGDTGNVNDDLLKRQKEIQLLISGSKNTTGKGYLLELEDVNSRKNGVQTNIKRIFFENKNIFCGGSFSLCVRFALLMRKLARYGGKLLHRH